MARDRRRRAWPPFRDEAPRVPLLTAIHGPLLRTLCCASLAAAMVPRRALAQSLPGITRRGRGGGMRARAGRWRGAILVST